MDANKDLISRVVCKVFQISMDELFTPTRRRYIVYPRQTAMAAMHKYGHSIYSIESYFNMTHGIFAHAIKQVEDRCETEMKFANQVKRVYEYLENIPHESNKIPELITMKKKLEEVADTLDMLIIANQK